MPTQCLIRAPGRMKEHLRYHERYSAAELEAQYNVRAARSDFADVVADWTARSAAARTHWLSAADIRYGAGARQLMDIYSAGESAPVLIYFHGGYWQGGDKSIYPFLSEVFVRQGISVVVPGYDLCPAVSLTHICEQAREAVAFLWREAAALGLSRDRIVVAGHSAGGHLTQILRSVDWPGFAPDLPADLIKAAVPISPLSLLEPVRRTTINDAVGMDAAEAAALSPLLGPPPRPRHRTLVAVGGAETSEFQRQARIYAQVFDDGADLMTVPEVDHFDIVNAFADPGSAFCAAVQDLCRAT